MTSFNSNPVPDPVFPPLPSQQPGATHPASLLIPRATKNWFLGLMVPHTLLECGSIVMSLLTIGFMQRIDAGEPYSETEANTLDGISGLIALAQLAIYLGMVVIFGIWFYRVVANAKLLNPGEGPSAGWAIGSFFIPIICLFRPYQAAKYAWSSTTNVLPAPRPGTALISAWWLSWIAVSVIGNVVARLSMSQTFGSAQPTIEELIGTQRVSIVLSVLALVLNVFAALYVHRMTILQGRAKDSAGMSMPIAA